MLFYFISRFLIYIYPWWSKRKKATQIITSVISIILVITITTVSIVIPIKRRNIEFTNHFQTNWEINILDHAKLKYSQSWSYGFVGGHDELVYAVYKLNKAQSDELSLLVPNQICALKSWHRIELDRIKKDHPNLEQKKYAELYFDNVLQRFRFSVPKRFLVDWKSENTYWGLRGGIAANYNHKSTDACLFSRRSLSGVMKTNNNPNPLPLGIIRFGFVIKWYSLRESNPQLALRRGLLYPFN